MRGRRATWCLALLFAASGAGQPAVAQETGSVVLQTAALHRSGGHRTFQVYGSAPLEGVLSEDGPGRLVLDVPGATPGSAMFSRVFVDPLVHRMEVSTYSDDNGGGTRLLLHVDPYSSHRLARRGRRLILRLSPGKPPQPAEPAETPAAPEAEEPPPAPPPAEPAEESQPAPALFTVREPLPRTSPGTSPPRGSVVVAEPLPTSPPVAPPPPAVLPDADSIEDAVREWAQAWTGQRVDDYLAAYAHTFRPASGLSQSEWRELRRRRLETPSYIEIIVSDLEVLSVEPDRARVRFRQAYRSNTFADVVVKTLELVPEDGEWRIAAETSAP